MWPGGKMWEEKNTSNKKNVNKPLTYKKCYVALFIKRKKNLGRMCFDVSLPEDYVCRKWTLASSSVTNSKENVHRSAFGST